MKLFWNESDAPVNLRLRDVRAGQALGLILRAAGGDRAAFGVDGNVVIVSSDEGLPKTAKRLEKPPVDPDLDKVLARHLPDIRFENVGLSDVVDFLRDITGMNLYLDLASLEQAGIERNTPVTMKLTDVAAGKVLDLLVADLGSGKTKVTCSKEGNVVVIGVAKAEK